MVAQPRAPPPTPPSSATLPARVAPGRVGTIAGRSCGAVPTTGAVLPVNGGLTRRRNPASAEIRTAARLALG
jgi:hypothetical protein